jgi:ubiquinone/menaquinone biosynthesis C-methylase UbiE
MNTRDDRCTATTAAPGASPRSIWQQFGRPTGVMGWLVGQLMAIKNRERSEWLIPLLEVRANDRVLELGFGPGVDVRRVGAAAPGVHVAGVDHSEAMLRQARKRNAAAIRAGRVDLRLGPVCPLPYADASFDRAFSVNSVQFWPDRDATFGELWRVLTAGGLLAIAIQPRNRGATDDTTREWGDRLSAHLEAARFRAIRLEFKQMRPVSAVCVLGLK